MPFVTVRFQNAKIGAITDSIGGYSIETYYATDSLIFTFSGYLKTMRFVELDTEQVIDVTLPVLSTDYEEVVATPVCHRIFHPASARIRLRIAATGIR